MGNVLLLPISESGMWRRGLLGKSSHFVQEPYDDHLNKTELGRSKEIIIESKRNLVTTV
jgi:hypothetical protein